MRRSMTPTSASRLDSSGRGTLIGFGSPLSRLTDGHRGWLGVLASLALISGLAESVVLVVIVQAALALSNQSPATLHVGPLQLRSLSVSVLLATALGATLLRTSCGLGVAWIGAKLTAEVQRNLRLATFDAYIDADWATQSQEREGGLQQMIGLEIDRAATAVLTMAIGIAAACTLVVLGASAFAVSPTAAFLLVASVGALFVLLRPLTGRIRSQATMRSTEELGMAQSLNELVRTAEEVRVHGVAEQEKRRLSSEASTVADWAARLTFSSLSISNIYQGFALGLMVGALFVASHLHVSSLASTGAIVLILLRAFAYSQQVQQAYHQLGERVASISTVDDHLRVLRAATEPRGTRPLNEISMIEFDAVSYSYRPDTKALNDISFKVSRGEVIGVVGPSGAGKSTLVQVILRLRQPDAGRYRVNGVDAAEHDAADWARLVSYLPQEPKLISGDIYENVRFHRDISRDRVEQVTRLVHLHDEIMALPSGYDTTIGQRADTLSGGQAQRLCLARALVTDPSVLVLDEPTSALDAFSERYVQDVLGRLRGRITTFIVAHRLSTLTICDRILVLRDGHLEALGTRERLADDDGFYRDALRLSGLL